MCGRRSRKIAANLIHCQGDSSHNDPNALRGTETGGVGAVHEPPLRGLQGSNHPNALCSTETWLSNCPGIGRPRSCRGDRPGTVVRPTGRLGCPGRSPLPSQTRQRPSARRNTCDARPKCVARSATVFQGRFNAICMAATGRASAG